MRQNLILLDKLLVKPDNYDSRLRTTTGAIIMIIGLGYPITENDEFVRIAGAAQLAICSPTWLISKLSVVVTLVLSLC
ncbi:hypothetical protein C8R43DRAFT_1156300 [Mycena crocata]|nr:hypothetical protein C8R43DRAFT_1156300 [Mycena crocata]